MAKATAAWLQTFRSGDASWWMLTTSTRKQEPSRSDGVRRTTRPRVVLPLEGPPADPSNPDHSASCATTYVMLKAVASTADQKPTALVDDDITTVLAPLAPRPAVTSSARESFAVTGLKSVPPAWGLAARRSSRVLSEEGIPDA